MGCFGYICPVCSTSIRGHCYHGGEKCVLIHKRDGKELGRTEGHYDEYGRVIEDKIFRNDDKNNINSHEEICKSEFGLTNSYSFGENKILPNKKVVRMNYFESMVWHFLDNHDWNELRTNPVFKKAFEKTENEIKNLSNFDESKLDTYLHLMLPSNLEIEYEKQVVNVIREWIKSLPIYMGESGIIAAHSKCFHSLTKEEQDALPFSKNDPDQSWGKIRKKYK